MNKQISSYIVRIPQRITYLPLLYTMNEESANSLTCETVHH